MFAESSLKEKDSIAVSVFLIAGHKKAAADVSYAKKIFIRMIRLRVTHRVTMFGYRQTQIHGVSKFLS